MSAALHLTAVDLRNLAAALDEMTEQRRNSGVTFEGRISAQSGETPLAVEWSEDESAYAIDDVVG